MEYILNATFRNGITSFALTFLPSALSAIGNVDLPENLLLCFRRRVDIQQQQRRRMDIRPSRMPYFIL